MEFDFPFDFECDHDGRVRADFDRHRDSAIVIDQGSDSLRYGYAGDADPFRTCKSLVARLKPSKASREGDYRQHYAGGGLPRGLVQSNATFRSPYDGSVLYHFASEELILDHVFASLGADNVSRNSIIFCEAFASPSASRALLNELLFECYNVEAVCYGVDAAFACRHCCGKRADNALIVSIGHCDSHVLPFVDGALDCGAGRRLEIGARASTDYLLQLLQLKYPQHRSLLSSAAAERLKIDHACVALNYRRALRGNGASVARRIVQLPMPPLDDEPTPLLAEQEARRRDARRAQMLRMRAMAAERQKTLDVERRQELATLRSIGEQRDAMPPREFAALLRANDIEGADGLDFAIERLERIVDGKARTTTKKATSEALKKAHEAIQRKKRARDARKEVEAAEQRALEERIERDPAGYVAELRARRDELSQVKRRLDSEARALSGRHSVSTQRRMRAIASNAWKAKKAAAASSSAKSAVDDDDSDPDDALFGIDDDDWQVYLTMSGEDAQSERDAIAEQLADTEALLARHEPLVVSRDERVRRQRADYQLELGVERVRVGEILFEPHMVGADEMGLAEVLEHAMRSYSAPVAASLAANVLVTGGGSLMPGTAERIGAELRAIMPSALPVNVRADPEPIVNAWRGASQWWADADAETQRRASLSRQQYHEQGAHASSFHHFASNATIENQANY
jgi:actin-related protein 5